MGRTDKADPVDVEVLAAKIQTLLKHRPDVAERLRQTISVDTTTSPPGATRAPTRSLLVGLALFVAGAAVGYAGGAKIWPGVKSRPAPKSPQVKQKIAAAQPKAPVSMDPDRAAFIQLVRENADDPADLEIVTWDKLEGDSRHVRFRCRLVGYGRKLIFLPGQPSAISQPTGEPIMLEDGYITYGDKGITQVYLGKTSKIWYAK